MSVFSKHFPLGLGTSRFPVTGPDDHAGLERSIQMVLAALEKGIDYIDVGYNYSAGMAPFVLKEAFGQTKKPFSVTAKVRYGDDYTADDARRRIEMHLNAMGLSHAAYFTCWCIWSYSDFEKIMEKGGIYEGALRLKEEGVIDHICCSLHAPPADMVRIIESGAFEGATVSYSLLNAVPMQPVLDAAQKAGVGIAVMNPLGGGVIAQNREYFSFACSPEDNGSTIHGALRFAGAHPAVDIVLGGAASAEELEDSAGVFATPDPEGKKRRMERVLADAAGLKGFCTGCKYCIGCPKGIPTAAIMQARNALLFQPVQAYNRQGPDELLYDLQIFRKLSIDEGWLPDTAENPCIRCGACEKRCTQKLPVMDGVAEIYRRAAKNGYSTLAHKNRLNELLNGKGYKRVGLYPNGGFSQLIMESYETFFGAPEFEWLLFNSDPKMWGNKDHGTEIHGPGEILQLRPDVIIVSTYRFDREIAQSLRDYERQGIKVEKLHREADAPWVF